MIRAQTSRRACSRRHARRCHRECPFCGSGAIDRRRGFDRELLDRVFAGRGYRSALGETYDGCEWGNDHCSQVPIRNVWRHHHERSCLLNFRTDRGIQSYQPDLIPSRTASHCQSWLSNSVDGSSLSKISSVLLSPAAKNTSSQPCKKVRQTQKNAKKAFLSPWRSRRYVFESSR